MLHAAPCLFVSHTHIPTFRLCNNRLCHVIAPVKRVCATLHMHPRLLMLHTSASTAPYNRPAIPLTLYLPVLFIHPLPSDLCILHTARLDCMSVQFDVRHGGPQMICPYVPRCTECGLHARFNVHDVRVASTTVPDTPALSRNLAADHVAPALPEVMQSMVDWNMGHRGTQPSYAGDAATAALRQRLCDLFEIEVGVVLCCVV